MRYFKIVYILLLLFPLNIFAKKSLNCEMIYLIHSDIEEARKFRTINITRELVDSVGQITQIIDSSYKELILDNDKEMSEIIIIDTFGFFIPGNCANLKVIGKVSERKKDDISDYYIITGIATGRNNALAIGISRLGSYKQIVYYILIKNGAVSIQDKYESFIGY